MNKVIFLDRDGVLNVDYNYVYEISKLKIIDWNKEALKWLKELGFLLIVVSNQSWVGRFYYTMKDVNNFNLELEKQLAIKFDEIYICPHIPENCCECRKPNVYNLEKSKKKYNIDFKKSYFVWDKESDIICWKNVWCKTVFINSWQYEINIKSDYTVSNLLEFYNKIKNDL